MQTYSVLLELARKFASQARVTTDREVARELWRMAIQYQDKAAALNNGKFPEFRYVIGWRLLDQGTPFEWPPFEWLKKSRGDDDAQNEKHHRHCQDSESYPEAH